MEISSYRVGFQMQRRGAKYDSRLSMNVGCKKWEVPGPRILGVKDLYVSVFSSQLLALALTGGRIFNNVEPEMMRLSRRRIARRVVDIDADWFWWVVMYIYM